MERKLVTIRKITEIIPIDGADFIELAMIGGWQCVVKKGEFKVGDLGVYFEIDSFLPMRKEFEFLGKTKKIHTGEEGYRLRTMKLKGQLSQGLLLPIDTFVELKELDIDFEKDYSEDLDVMLWTTPLPVELGGICRSTFPTHIIPKTDQERIQNLSRWFDKYPEVEFEETEKLDGMSVTYYIHEGEFAVCSRNQDLIEIEGNALWNMAKKLDLAEKMFAKGGNFAFQGELCGPGIQKNPLHLEEVDFFVYDIWDIEEQRYYTSKERVDLVTSLGLKHVPFNTVNVKILSKTMKEIIEYVKVKSIFGDFQREGCVFKSINKVDGKIISFKAINNDYLLKHGG